MLKRFVFAVVMTLLSPVAGTLGTANSSKPKESFLKIEVKLIPERSVIRPGEPLKLKVEIWNVGAEDTIIAQNMGETYFNAALDLYLEVGSRLQHSNVGSAADAIPEPNPDLAKTFVTNWLTLRRNHCYGTLIYMDPFEFPQLRKPGHYRVKAEYISGGISSGFAMNAARLNSEDIEKLPFKAWAGTIDSSFVRIQVSPPMKQNPGKK